MKEATGELNLTVIVVVMIGMLIAFFFFTFWPMIESNLNQTSRCSKAICTCKGGMKDGICNSKVAECYVMNSDGRQSDKFECVWKG